MQTGTTNQMGDGHNVKKIHLRECIDFSTYSNVRMLRVSKPQKKLSGQVRITTTAINGFEEDYAKDEYKPRNFELVAYSSDTVAFTMKIDEQILESMLKYIKEEKQKVYYTKEGPAQ